MSASIRLAALLGIVFLVAQLLLFEHGRDQGIYSLVAQGALGGEPPYAGTWDFKTPGIYAVYAVAHAAFGPSMLAVRILEALGLIALCFAIQRLTFRFLDSALAGWVAALVAVLGYVQLEFWSTAQPESFGAVCLAYAILLTTESERDDEGGSARGFVRWLIAGGLFTFAGLLKPPLGGGILVALFALRKRPGRTRLFIAMVLGALLPLATTLLYFTSQGAADELADALFVFTPRYTGISLSLREFPGFLLRSLWIWLARIPPYAGIGILLLLLLPPSTEREREGVLFISLVLAFSLIGVALQAKFFDYHYGAVVPLGGMLSAWGFWKLFVRVQENRIGLAASITMFLAIHFGGIVGLGSPNDFWRRSKDRIVALNAGGERGRSIRDSLYSKPNSRAAANRKAAAWVEQNTSSDSALFVWGFEPTIYLMSKRRPASRFVYNAPLRTTWDDGSYRQLLMQDLDRSSPAAIIVQEGDVLPYVTGGNEDSRQALDGFPALEAWIRQHYEPTEKFGGLEVLRRRP